jgi:hypothetical protein
MYDFANGRQSQSLAPSSHAVGTAQLDLTYDFNPPLQPQSSLPLGSTLPEPQASTFSDVSSVLTHLRIEDDLIKAAQYNRKLAGLCNKVKNYLAMSEILRRMGFDSSQGSRVVDQYQLQKEDVLKHFTWAPPTYVHKTTWYSWAEEVAKKRWTAQVPSCKFQLDL